MKKLVLASCAALALSLSSVDAFAGDKPHKKMKRDHYRADLIKQGNPKNKHWKKKRDKDTHSVPEIDGAGAALALGLIGAIAAIRRERKKRA